MSEAQPTSAECATWMKALGEPLRLEIVRLLVAGPRTVSALAEALDVEMTTASHHLQVLFHAGLVKVQKDGRFSVYQINPEFLRNNGSAKLATLDFGCCQVQMKPNP